MLEVSGGGWCWKFLVGVGAGGFWWGLVLEVSGGGLVLKVSGGGRTI